MYDFDGPRGDSLGARITVMSHPTANVHVPYYYELYVDLLDLASTLARVHVLCAGTLVLYYCIVLTVR